jgi:hypothetical protein
MGHSLLSTLCHSISRHTRSIEMPHFQSAGLQFSEVLVVNSLFECTRLTDSSVRYVSDPLTYSHHTFFQRPVFFCMYRKPVAKGCCEWCQCRRRAGEWKNESRARGQDMTVCACVCGPRSTCCNRNTEIVLCTMLLPDPTCPVRAEACLMAAWRQRSPSAIARKCRYAHARHWGCMMCGAP